MNVTKVPAAAVPRQRGTAMAERGTTTVRDRAVARIAARAVTELSESRELARGLGRLREPESGRVQVRRSGRVVVLRLRVGLTFPVPLRQTTARLRSHVSNRVQELTGLSVRRVDIEVARLTLSRGVY